MSGRGECISIHIGQAGCQIGNACWDLYCHEHGIGKDGTRSDATNDDDTFESFFAEDENGKYVPRAVFIDLEYDTLDKIRTGSNRQLFPEKQIIYGHGKSAANNFQTGYLTRSHRTMEKAMDRIGKMTEECFNFQGFLVFNSLGGGTGSGATAQLLNQLARQYGGKTIVQFAVSPFRKLASAIVEPYNSLLHTYNVGDRADCSFLFDNEALFDVCSKSLNLSWPTFSTLNQLIARVVSSITTSLRFEVPENNSLENLAKNLVVYPKLRYPLISYAPIASAKNSPEQPSVSDITNLCFEPESRLVKGDTALGKYMACSLMYRGDVDETDVKEAIQEIQNKHSATFSDWTPDKFKFGINNQPTAVTSGSDFARAERSLCVLSNTTAIQNIWTRLSKKYDGLYKKRAFVHWYTTMGMDEGDFQAALDDVSTLEDDYKKLDTE